MTIAEIEDVVRGYIVESFLSGTTAQGLLNDGDLFAVLDSLQVLRLVVELEARFGVQVLDADLTAENLGSVRRAADFVARQRCARANGAPTMTERGASRAPVVVCGAGAAGMAAALAAARAGSPVLLVETSPAPGGTVADCLIHTLGGLYDAGGELLNGGLAGELADALLHADPATRRRRLGRTWVLNVCPDVYRTVARRLLAAEPNLTVLCEARVVAVSAVGGCIRSVRIRPVHKPEAQARESWQPEAQARESWQPEAQATGRGGQEASLNVRALIDATGAAEVVRLLDEGLVQGAAPLAAGGLIVKLRGVAAEALAFPRGAALVRALRTAAAGGELPAECGNAWLDGGVRDDEAFLKLFVPLPPDWRARAEALRAAALDSGEAVIAYLRRLPGFQQVRIAAAGRLGVHEGGRIRGEYCLTEEDVRRGRKFPDAACRCAWPIEYWDPQHGVSLDYLSEAWYEIPLRALRVQGLSNFWAAGKCLSADARAQASARIAGCCWSMGEAVGKLCARGCV